MAAVKKGLGFPGLGLGPQGLALSQRVMVECRVSIVGITNII